MRKLSKQAKSAMAIALAAVLAAPTMSLLTKPAAAADGDEADLGFPTAIKVYDFESSDGITMSTAAAASGNAATIEQDGSHGGVYAMKDAKPVYVVSSDGVTLTDKVDYYVNSSAKIANPFVGKDYLVEKDPQFLSAEDDMNGAPLWEMGVTVSYWQKTSGTGEGSEGSMIAFNSQFDDVVDSDDLDKMNIAAIHKEKGNDDPLFSLGTVSEWTDERLEAEGNQYKGKPVTNGCNGKTRKIYEDFGMFILFNENYVDGGYYFKPLVNAAGEVQSYTITPLSSNPKPDVKSYYSTTGEDTKVKLFSEKGSLSFKASGAFGFFESGTGRDYYVNGKYSSTNASKSQQNHAFAYTYEEDNGVKTYLPVEGGQKSLVDDAEWHYITYVIQNGGVNLYVDGQPQEELFRNIGGKTSEINFNKRFNLGWGYYLPTAPDSVYNKKMNGMGIFECSDAICIGANGDQHLYEEDGKTYKLGYNGNTNCKTIMEILTDPDTELWLGEDGNSTVSYDAATGKLVYDLQYGSKEGAKLDDLAFFDLPLSDEEVAALYDYVSASDDNVPAEGPDHKPAPKPSETEPAGQETNAPTETQPAGQETKAPTETQPAGQETKAPTETQPAGTQTNAPTPTQPSGTQTNAPTPTQPAGTQTTPPTDTAKPSTPPTGTVVLGDADGNGKVDLEDARVVLYAALAIGEPLKGDAREAADVNGDGTINLEDANRILKVALGIDKDFLSRSVLMSKLGL